MAVVMRSGEVPRYNASERVTHWIVAILFVLLAASGLALFHPAFWFLSALLGGGPWSRILHPFLGVAMFLSFGALALQVLDDNRIDDADRQWMKRLRDYIENRDANMPEIGKYNAGQKYAFWTILGCL